MSDLNQVVLDGRLVRAAELSYFPDGTPYCNFTIGNNETWKKEDGTYDSIGSFFDCTMKGSYASAMAKYLLKGVGVTVTGRLKQQKWEKDGQKYSRIIIKVDWIRPRASHQNNGEMQQNVNIPGQNTQQSYPQQNAQTFQPCNPEQNEYIPFGDSGDMEEDIPF